MRIFASSQFVIIGMKYYVYAGFDYFKGVDKTATIGPHFKLNIVFKYTILKLIDFPIKVNKVNQGLRLVVFCKISDFSTFLRFLHFFWLLNSYSNLYNSRVNYEFSQGFCFVYKFKWV